VIAALPSGLGCVWLSFEAPKAGKDPVRSTIIISQGSGELTKSQSPILVVVSDEKTHLQYLDMGGTIEHCAKGIGIWPHFSTDAGLEPDLVMASCGDVSTHESLAAIDLLLQHFPDLKVRCVNCVDLFKLIHSTEHPHGLTDQEWTSLFTSDKPIIFNFHGYPWMVHRLTYKRPGSKNLHVRGYREKGNIDTPLELAIRNHTDRFSLAIEAIDCMPHLRNSGSAARQALLNAQISACNIAFETGMDHPFLTNWTWQRNGLWVTNRKTPLPMDLNV
jgi:xylulose-5-phosphate/fructose-6-phosphate phosphoketolase